jgi:hypothetical protein
VTECNQLLSKPEKVAVALEFVCCYYKIAEGFFSVKNSLKRHCIFTDQIGRQIKSKNSYTRTHAVQHLKHHCQEGVVFCNISFCLTQVILLAKVISLQSNL